MLREPNDCCLDGKGGLLIADVGDWRIRRVNLKTGTITTFAGTGKPARKPERSRIGDGGLAKDAVIVGARVCVDGKGKTYICEREGSSIRQVDESGVITTIAGMGVNGYSGDGGPALARDLPGAEGDPLGPGRPPLRGQHREPRDPQDRRQHRVVTTVADGHQGPDGDGRTPPRRASTGPTAASSAPTGLSISPTAITIGSAGSGFRESPGSSTGRFGPDRLDLI